MLLKPGGHILAFGGSRTYHGVASAIEQAGGEIRDSFLTMIASDDAVLRFMDSLSPEQIAAFFRCIEESQFGGLLAWVYGSGFPKSHNQDGEWEGWGTALKPAFEPIVMAQRPFDGSVAANLGRHGVGAINIDGCRVPTDEDLNGGAYSGALRRRGEYTSTDTAQEAVPLSRLNRGAGEYVQPAGRWPANVIHDGSDEVLEVFARAGARGAKAPVTGDEPSMAVETDGRVYKPRMRTPGAFHADAGSAARFFYCAKATKAERAGSKHPTVKPIALMRYLCRLVTPKGGLILDPFAGTGTTGQAALEEGCRAILIEREAEYVADIRRRLQLGEAAE
jgi:site-specific DNA-methyltransferase (adenine-specific)